jgi:hypothetical protein
MDAFAKLNDSLLPDLATQLTVRKKRAPKHDFKDGRGRVFAHRHDNGGGWVADTAWVAPAAKVTRNAQVFGFARVDSLCEVAGTARVYEHARLFDRARVSQQAEVGGCAKILDNSVLSGNAHVSGNALICGNSDLSRRVRVSGYAVVHNTTITGPHKNGCATVGDSARLLNCTVHGNTRVLEAAVCENSHLIHAYVYNTARIINSRLQAQLNYRYYHYLNGRTPLDADLAPLETQVIAFCSTAISSTFQSAPVLISPYVHLINSQFAFSEYDEIADLFSGLRFRFLDFNGHGMDSVRRHIEQATAPRFPHAVATAAAMPSLASRPASFDSVGQRRIMRMEETP